MSTRNLADEELTRAVLASFGDCRSDRFEEVVRSLVGHLHAFASEVELTEEEWFAGIDFLTRTGHITDDKRQEFILLSDVLGLSMLVVGLNHARHADATPSTVFGPFFVDGSPRFAERRRHRQRRPGRALPGTGTDPVGDRRAASRARGSRSGRPTTTASTTSSTTASTSPAGAAIWPPSPTAASGSGRSSRSTTRSPPTARSASCSAAANRSPMRPAHVHFMVSADGYETVTTHVFADGDPYLDSDAVFGVKSELIAPVVRHEPGQAPDGRELNRPYWSITYDIVLTHAAS